MNAHTGYCLLVVKWFRFSQVNRTLYMPQIIGIKGLGMAQNTPITPHYSGSGPVSRFVTVSCRKCTCMVNKPGTRIVELLLACNSHVGVSSVGVTLVKQKSWIWTHL